MAGHNKWSKIKRQKGVLDAKRGAIFTKLVKNITAAAKQGGGEIDLNPSLRVAIAQAKEASMPHANIQKAIDKALGNIAGVVYQDITYEGYGPNGVAVLIEAMSDNKNRTVANIRLAFNKAGGSLGENGCVGWMFEKKGILVVGRDGREEELMELALENNASDINEYEEVMVIECEPSEHSALVGAIDAQKFDIMESKIELIAENELDVDEETAMKIQELVERLEEDEDVQNVYTNVK